MALIKSTCMAVLGAALMFNQQLVSAADMSHGANNFYQNNQVNAQKVHFKNIYGMDVVGTLFTPKSMDHHKKYATLVVGHPFQAVRQQAANLYATKMAEVGFVTLSFDQSYWGESAGQPRGAVLPDVYTENFSAAIDYLGTRPFVDKEKIGVIGICGSGGFSIAAAKIDTRIKALATVSMYNMGEFFRTGLNHTRTVEDRNKILAAASEQRDADVAAGTTAYNIPNKSLIGPETLASNDFYETERGKVPSNNRLTTITSNVKLMNFYPFQDIESISPRPILFVVGEVAPSRDFTDEAYKLAKEPKELVIVKGANRIDLYDRVEMIPWGKLTAFFNQNLNH